MGTLHLSGLKEVHVPQEDFETAYNSVSSWKSISDPQEIVNHIIKQNDIQFSQARFTLLADTPLGRRIGRYGDTQTAKQVLSGTFETTGLSAEIGRLLQSFLLDPRIKPYEQTISPSMFKEAFIHSQKRSLSLHQVDTLGITKQHTV